MDDATMLAELAPTAERLVDRHLGMAKEWFPHDLVEWRPPPEVGCAEPLPDGVASALFVNVLTEDNLPYYFASIDNLFGRDGAWGYWTRRWTAEEGRHSIVLRDYLIMSGHIDPVDLERARMAQVTGGVSPDAETIADAFVYLALQELATRIAHHNTGKALPDAEGYAVMKRVAADENLHYLFYRDLVSAALEIDPSGMMEAIKRQVLGFEMPGTGIPDFAQHAKAIARAGIYDLGVHHDAILRPVVLGHWDVAGRQGLTPSAEAARNRLLQFITRLGRASARVKEPSSRVRGSR
jgi:acyl-[acyl-carrier-protein] desaturase